MKQKPTRGPKNRLGPRRTISVVISEQTAALLDARAAQQARTRSQFVRRLIEREVGR